MHYIAIDKTEFDYIMKMLEKAQQIARDFSADDEYPKAAGYLQGAISSALIQLGVTQEFHTHEGSAWEIRKPSLTYSMDLSAEILPELELGTGAEEEVRQAPDKVSDIFALSV